MRHRFDFDELAKMLAGDISRREALRGIGATVAGIVFASLGLKASAAAPDACCKERCHALGIRGSQCVKGCSGCVSSGSYACVRTGGVICDPSAKPR
jgi:hypothetical protein